VAGHRKHQRRPGGHGLPRHQHGGSKRDERVPHRRGGRRLSHPRRPCHPRYGASRQRTSRLEPSLCFGQDPRPVKAESRRRDRSACPGTVPRGAELHGTVLRSAARPGAVVFRGGRRRCHTDRGGKHPTGQQPDHRDRTTNRPRAHSHPHSRGRAQTDPATRPQTSQTDGKPGLSGRFSWRAAAYLARIKDALRPLSDDTSPASRNTPPPPARVLSAQWQPAPHQTSQSALPGQGRTATASTRCAPGPVSAIGAKDPAACHRLWITSLDGNGMVTPKLRRLCAGQGWVTCASGPIGSGHLRICPKTPHGALRASGSRGARVRVVGCRHRYHPEMCTRAPITCQILRP
jgi:hypothetical protein